MTERKKIVWVLGAGFSRSLGGPLLTDMFSETSAAITWRVFPHDAYKHLYAPCSLDQVLAAYRWGLRNWKWGEYDLWQNAEEFLDILDSAHENPRSPIRALMENHGGVPEPMRDMGTALSCARRFLAAECAAFLEYADVSTERWQPYRRWATEHVDGGDTIITFNYDQVLEKLIRACLPTSTPARYTVRRPGVTPSDSKAQVLKLHGSVDWERNLNPGTGEVTYRIDEKPVALTAEDDGEVALAAPGPTKLRRAKELDCLWTAAEAALREAGVVIFLGYRFPPTDSEARSRLLGALSENKQDDVSVHTVLGPDIHSPDSARLAGLLHHTLRSTRFDRESVHTITERGTYSVTAQPLYAEDYLSVFTRSP